MIPKTNVPTAISPGEFARLASLVRAEAGIALTEAKAPLVHSRLSRRLKSLNLGDYDSYFRLVTSPEGREERRRMLSALTTNVTKFFRERHHFEQLETQTLPAILQRVGPGGRIRIWSAGCSSGEEPYSIAMTLLNSLPDISALDVRILATDIDPAVIETARRGVYPEESLAEAPSDLVSRYFDLRQGRASATAQLRALITFKELNLMRDWPMKGPFDIIFCRNVVIYFDADTQDRLMIRFASILKPGGALFLGHSERVGPGASARLERHGLTSYRRIEESP